MTDFDWNPFANDRFIAEEVGDAVKGKISAIRIEKGQRGDYPVVTLQIDAEGHTKEIHCPTDLQRKLADVNAQVGDWLAAELVELKHTGQPSPMKVFKVAWKPAEENTTQAADEEADVF